jgi:isoquinoline 1-oxidoreductase subunit beta
MNDMPRVDVHLVASTEKPGGIGEPIVATTGPSVANAVFIATGKRIRKLPILADDLNKA